jgi:hypothetical protein
MDKHISEQIAEQTSEFIVNLVDDLIEHDGNCKVRVHAIRHSGDMMRFRVEVQEVNVREDGVEMTPEAKSFVELAGMSMSMLSKAGLTPEHLGYVFTTNGDIRHKITGWNRNARKRPVLTKRLDSGQEYAWTVNSVARYLGDGNV